MYSEELWRPAGAHPAEAVVVVAVDFWKTDDRLVVVRVSTFKLNSLSLSLLLSRLTHTQNEHEMTSAKSTTRSQRREREEREGSGKAFDFGAAELT